MVITSECYGKLLYIQCIISLFWFYIEIFCRIAYTSIDLDISTFAICWYLLHIGNLSTSNLIMHIIDRVNQILWILQELYKENLFKQKLLAFFFIILWIFSAQWQFLYHISLFISNISKKIFRKTVHFLQEVKNVQRVEMQNMFVSIGLFGPHLHRKYKIISIRNW